VKKWWIAVGIIALVACWFGIFNPEFRGNGITVQPRNSRLRVLKAERFGTNVNFEYQPLFSRTEIMALKALNRVGVHPNRQFPNPAVCITTHTNPTAFVLCVRWPNGLELWNGGLSLVDTNGVFVAGCGSGAPPEDDAFNQIRDIQVLCFFVSSNGLYRLQRGNQTLADVTIR
jgi:hypothetical protein